MWTVLKVLVCRVSVDRIHEKLLHTEGFVQHKYHRHEAVGGTACVADDKVAGLHVLVVGTNHEGRHVVGFWGSGQHHPFCASLDVAAG